MRLLLSGHGVSCVLLAVPTSEAGVSFLLLNGVLDAVMATGECLGSEFAPQAAAEKGRVLNISTQ